MFHDFSFLSVQTIRSRGSKDGTLSQRVSTSDFLLRLEQTEPIKQLESSSITGPASFNFPKHGKAMILVSNFRLFDKTKERSQLSSRNDSSSPNRPLSLTCIVTRLVS